jgi:hypothetical protein
MSRKKELDVSKITPEPKYSDFLRQAILEATEWDPRNRPDPIQMVKELKRRMKQARMDTHAQGPEDLLPSWATRVHDYHSREPIDPSQFAQGEPTFCEMGSAVPYMWSMFRVPWTRLSHGCPEGSPSAALFTT